MKDVGQSGLIWSRTTDLDPKISISKSPLFKTVSNKGLGMVSFGNNEKANYFFVSVNDEVASSL
jgi:hypothetical protein